MNSRLRRKFQAIALGSIFIVTQCCCCIVPIRWQVDRNTPGVQASAPDFLVERVFCELKSAMETESGALAPGLLGRLPRAAACYGYTMRNE